MVEGAVDDAAVAYHDGLEEVLLPLLVPVLVFGFGVAEVDGGVGQGKVGHGLAYRFLVVQVLLDVGGNAVGLLDEALETRVAQQGAEHVVGSLRAGAGVEGKF